MIRDPRALEEFSSVLSAATDQPRDQLEGAPANKQDLGRDLEDPQGAVKANLPSFERKLEVLQRQIIDEAEKIVVRESDRVIESVIAGPHDRLLDKVGAVMYSPWIRIAFAYRILCTGRIYMPSGKKWYVIMDGGCQCASEVSHLSIGQGWRGSVKAKHFVLALRDYYYARVEGHKQKAIKYEEPNVHDFDMGFSGVLVFGRLQSISEAFDADGSGFVTIAEANQFTSSRPPSWR